MATHPGMLLAYDEAGEIVATLDHLVAYDEAGDPLGLVDFAAHEEAGGELTDVWTVAGDGLTIKGSKVWPEWLGSRAHDFRVELEGPAGAKRIAALVHRESGHRRERAAVEQAIADRIRAAGDRPADIRDLVGGPDRPLSLDERGRTAPRAKVKRPALPLVGVGRPERPAQLPEGTAGRSAAPGRVPRPEGRS